MIRVLNSFSFSVIWSSADLSCILLVKPPFVYVEGVAKLNEVVVGFSRCACLTLVGVHDWRKMPYNVAVALALVWRSCCSHPSAKPDFNKAVKNENTPFIIPWSALEWKGALSLCVCLCCYINNSHISTCSLSYLESPHSPSEHRWEYLKGCDPAVGGWSLPPLKASLPPAGSLPDHQLSSPTGFNWWGEEWAHSRKGSLLQ